MPSKKYDKGWMDLQCPINCLSAGIIAGSKICLGLAEVISYVHFFESICLAVMAAAKYLHDSLQSSKN